MNKRKYASIDECDYQYATTPADEIAMVRLLLVLAILIVTIVATLA